jgi:hypothetical protein
MHQLNSVRPVFDHARVILDRFVEKMELAQVHPQKLRFDETAGIQNHATLLVSHPESGSVRSEEKQLLTWYRDFAARRQFLAPKSVAFIPSRGFAYNVS